MYETKKLYYEDVYKKNLQLKYWNAARARKDMR